MTSVTEHLSRKIRDLREGKGWTQAKLAGKVGVTANTVSRWESGTYKPKLDDLERLSREFGKPIWAFLPSELAPPTEAHRALLSATGDLPEEDLEELARYAEFVRARKALQKRSHRQSKKENGSK